MPRPIQTSNISLHVDNGTARDDIPYSANENDTIEGPNVGRGVTRTTPIAMTEIQFETSSTASRSRTLRADAPVFVPRFFVPSPETPSSLSEQQPLHQYVTQQCHYRLQEYDSGNGLDQNLSVTQSVNSLSYSEAVSPPPEVVPPPPELLSVFSLTSFPFLQRPSFIEDQCEGGNNLIEKEVKPSEVSSSWRSNSASTAETSTMTPDRTVSSNESTFAELLWRQQQQQRQLQRMERERLLAEQRKELEKDNKYRAMTLLSLFRNLSSISSANEETTPYRDFVGDEETTSFVKNQTPNREPLISNHHRATSAHVTASDPTPQHRYRRWNSDSRTKDTMDFEKDKEFFLAAISKNPDYALEIASDQLRQDKDVVMAAISRRGQALRYASDELRASKDIVLAAVSNDGLALQYALDEMKADKDVVLAAVANKPEALKYAMGGLKQDHDCWIAAKLWKKGDIVRKYSPDCVRIPLSTKYSLDEQSRSCATKFTALLNKAYFFREGGQFLIYSPNAFSKDSCDPCWTRMEWPCRGTFQTCRIADQSLKTGIPNDRSCWRYSYRYHLEEAKRTNGFMIQVVDYNEKQKRHILGKGQAIETVMAYQVGTKIFRVCQPVSGLGLGRDFIDQHMVRIVDFIHDWYANHQEDTAGLEIQFWSRYFGRTSWLTRSRKLDDAEVDIESLCPW